MENNPKYFQKGLDGKVSRTNPAMFDDIKENINSRMKEYGDSRQPTGDEVRIAWLVMRVEELMELNHQLLKHLSDSIGDRLEELKHELESGNWNLDGETNWDDIPPEYLTDELKLLKDKGLSLNAALSQIVDDSERLTLDSYHKKELSEGE